MSNRIKRISVTDVVAIDEMLRNNPHAAVESQDDAQCMLFFEQLGMLQCFPRSEEPTLSTLIHREHPTHWILGLLWSGYAKPEENGYRLFCLPKIYVSEQEVHEFEQFMMKAYGGHDYKAGIVYVPKGWKNRN